MADDSNTNYKQADSQYNILRKILARLNLGISTSGGGGGGGGGGAVTVADGADVAQGATTNAAATDSTSAWTVVSLLKGLYAKLAGVLTVSVNNFPGTQPVSGTVAVSSIGAGAAVIGHVIADSGSTTAVTGNVAVTNAGLTNIDVALSTRLKPADTLAAVTTVGTITNPVTVAQATAANLKVDLSGTGANATALKVDGSAVTQPVSGNIGGFTTVIKDASVVTAAAYTAGNAVGAKRTLANAVKTAGTGILQSITLLDRANQKAGMTVFIFDADPTNATITDKTAFVFSTDDLKVIAQISIAAGDYVTTNSKAIAQLSGLSIPVKAASGTSLFCAIVTTGTPTFAATTDVQLEVGILQD
jgi:hypothetical protein